MRVRRISTENFAGLGDVDLQGLDDHAELFLSGRNGIGKSQLLIAIAMAWQRNIGDEYRKYIGARGPEAKIQVEFTFNANETEAIIDVGCALRADFTFTGDTSIVEILISKVAYQRVQWRDSNGDTSIHEVLSNPDARSQLPFAAVTYLPADRYVARDQELTMSLSSLARSKADQIGEETLNQAVADWNQVHNFDVFSSLAALHYAGLLEKAAHPEAPVLSRDFDEITSAFERATGKVIAPPTVKEDGSIALEATVPSGDSHPLTTLSSGELVALQLMHFMRLHYRRGSILLVDEPEQHLHPSLQVEVVNSIRGESTDGQLWLATHSPNVLNAVDSRDVVTLARDPETRTAKATFADDQPRRIELLRDLGVAPGLWTPGNFIAIVEGSTDQAYLRRLLPEAVNAAYFVVAGGRSSVRSVANEMEDSGELPFIAICDRDGGSNAEREQWNGSDQNFMWSGYAIESMFLNHQLLTQTHSDYGEAMTSDAVIAELARVFDRQREGAFRTWLEFTISKRVESRDEHRAPLVKNYTAASEVANERAEYLANNENDLAAKFADLWETDPLRFIEPKRALAEFRSPVFKTRDHLVSAEIRIIERDPSLVPGDLATLRAKLERLT